MKKFYTINKNFNQLSLQDKGIIFASCLDARTSVYLSFCEKQYSVKQLKSVAIFTNKRRYEESIKKGVEKYCIPILLYLPKDKYLFKNICKNGRKLINEFSQEYKEKLAHNSYSAFVLDRHIKASLNYKITPVEALELVTGFLSPYINCLSCDELNDSIYMTEGTTYVDIVCSYLLSCKGVRTISIDRSRLPSKHTLIFEDIFESNLINSNTPYLSCDENLYDIPIPKAGTGEIVYTYQQIRSGNFHKAFVQGMKSLIRVIVDRYRYNDSFNRPSWIGLLNKYFGLFTSFILKNILNKTSIYVPKPSKKDLVFYTHVSPERSIDIIGKLPFQINQLTLIRKISKSISKNQNLFLMIHPEDIRVYNLFSYIFLFLKYKNVFLINKNDKFAKDTNVISISGSIIIERLRKGLPTYHCCDTYYGKPLKDYRYCSPSELLYLVEERIKKDNFMIDKKLIDSFKKIIFSGSIVKGNIWTNNLDLDVINKCYEKITCGS